jgi:hypothetical protein
LYYIFDICFNFGDFESRFEASKVVKKNEKDTTKFVSISKIYTINTCTLLVFIKQLVEIQKKPYIDDTSRKLWGQRGERGFSPGW